MPRQDLAVPARLADGLIRVLYLHLDRPDWGPPGPLAEDYRVVKERADLAVRRGGVEFLSNGWSIPEDIMNCGLAYLVYDWIHDALDLQERERWGGALGSWLHYFTGKPEILLKWGHWEYNQTWAPST